MMAMVKIVLLLLVVFEASALENSHEIDSNHELHPYSPPPKPLLPYPPQASRIVDEEKLSTVECYVQCVLSCGDKKSFKKALCIGICIAKCTLSPSDSPHKIACAVNCAQSSTNNLRYDASMMNDQISSCNQQCKKD